MFFSLVSYQPMYLLVNTTLTGKGANLCLYSALAGRSHDSHVQIHLFEWFAKMAIMIVVFKGHLNPKYLFTKIYFCTCLKSITHFLIPICQILASNPKHHLVNNHIRRSVGQEYPHAPSDSMCQKMRTCPFS